MYVQLHKYNGVCGRGILYITYGTMFGKVTRWWVGFSSYMELEDQERCHFARGVAPISQWEGGEEVVILMFLQLSPGDASANATRRN